MRTYLASLSLILLLLLALSDFVRLQLGPDSLTISAEVYGQTFYLDVGREGIRAGKYEG